GRDDASTPPGRWRPWKRATRGVRATDTMVRRPKPWRQSGRPVRPLPIERLLPVPERAFADLAGTGGVCFEAALSTANGRVSRSGANAAIVRQARRAYARVAWPGTR